MTGKKLDECSIHTCFERICMSSQIEYCVMKAIDLEFV